MKFLRKALAAVRAQPADREARGGRRDDRLGVAQSDRSARTAPLVAASSARPRIRGRRRRGRSPRSTHTSRNRMVPGGILPLVSCSARARPASACRACERGTRSGYQPRRTRRPTRIPSHRGTQATIFFDRSHTRSLTVELVQHIWPVRANRVQQIVRWSRARFVEALGSISRRRAPATYNCMRASGEREPELRRAS